MHMCMDSSWAVQPWHECIAHPTGYAHATVCALSSVEPYQQPSVPGLGFHDFSPPAVGEPGGGSYGVNIDLISQGTTQARNDGEAGRPRHDGSGNLSGVMRSSLWRRSFKRGHHQCGIKLS